VRRDWAASCLNRFSVNWSKAFWAAKRAVLSGWAAGSSKEPLPAAFAVVSKTVFFSASGVEFGKSEQPVIRHRDNTSARMACRYFCVRCFIEISFLGYNDRP